jgi:hypothetical protein
MSGASCLPLVGRARAAAPASHAAAAARVPTPVWLPVPAPGDDSDCEGAESVEEPPARQLFDVRACAAPEERPAARRTAHDGGAAAEVGALLRGFATASAQGASPQQRMLAVCRIVLAHTATWLKPAVAPPPSAMRMPGAHATHRFCDALCDATHPRFLHFSSVPLLILLARNLSLLAGTLGTHIIRRFDLPSAAPGDGDTPPGGAGPESVLFFQEQSVLRTVCFADQYLHASQRVTASMRVHIKARARSSVAVCDAFAGE